MRKLLPKTLERNILVKNRHCCCICQSIGFGHEVLIHHIDGNNSNNILENLAVLCLVHASQADAGLVKGKLGSGKKLKPDEIKEYKRIWEKKIEVENKIPKRQIPIYKKRQIEILYDFEIHKIKNELLSFKGNDKRINDKLSFLDQLVVEEFISGIKIRNILIEAYHDIAFQSPGSGVLLTKRLAKSIWGLFIHLVGPDYVQISKDDRILLKGSIDALTTLGEFAAEFNDDKDALSGVCSIFYDLYEITHWYHLTPEKKSLIKSLNKISKTCSKFKDGNNSRKSTNERRARQRIVHNTLKRMKKYDNS